MLPLTHLAWDADAPADAEEDHSEDEEQTETQAPADGAQVMKPRGLVHLQHVTPVEEESRGMTLMSSYWPTGWAGDW